MLTRATKLKVAVFAVIALLVIGQIGINYAKLGYLIGRPGYYTVTLLLAQTGGLFPEAGVTYRGVTVGRVGDMHLTSSGLTAELRIDDGSPPIPANLKAVVANLSAVGEQYVDLRPVSEAGPYLRPGSSIAQADTATPYHVTETLASLNALTASVPLESLRTFVDELGLAFEGQGPNLRALLQAQSSLVTAADANLEPTVRLIDDGAVVLRTQNEEGAQLRAFARNLKLFNAQLKASDPDLRKLVTAAPPAATEVARLVRDLDPGFSVLVANLLTTANLTYTRQRGLEHTLVRLPQVVAQGTTAVNGGVFSFGLVNTFFNPLPCNVGYQSTRYRNGLDTHPGPAFNTTAHCALPPSTGIGVRGAANAPKGGVPNAARPGGYDLGDDRYEESQPDGLEDLLWLDNDAR